jgi:hypothetical protein
VATNLTRRKFYGGLGKLALAAGATDLSGAASEKCGARAIMRVTRGPKALDVPPTTPQGQSWHYMLSFPFQLAPRLAALSCNMKANYGPGQDFEGGMDLIPFDDFRRIRVEKAIPLTRNHEEKNPNASGKPSIMVKYPGPVGFVPRGAKRRDGTPHPHAGTGFVFSKAKAWPMDDSEGVADFPDRKGRGVFTAGKMYMYFEFFPFSFDGAQIVLGKREVMRFEDFVPGWRITNTGLTNAIPDGDDLLMGMQGGMPGKTAGSGLMRWRRRGGHWDPVSFDLITPEDNSLEPSVVQDIDGSLLFCARGKRETGPPIRIWRSRDGGGKWERIIFINGLVGSVPISLNQAVDGTPYIASNIKTPMIQVPGGDGGISRLEPKGGRGERSTLCIWPLNEARNGLESPLIARDPLTEFGVPPHGSVWAVDHPSAMTLHLADRNWHNVMGYRMLEWMENTHYVGPTPQTGGYLEEVISAGNPIETWGF